MDILPDGEKREHSQQRIWHRPSPDQPGTLAEIGAALWHFAHDDDSDRDRAWRRARNTTHAHLQPEGG